MSPVVHNATPACLFSGDDLARMKRKFDMTCEELGVYPEDAGARSSLGRALVAAIARCDVALPDEEPVTGATEIVCFEGEELVVVITDRPGH